MIKKLLSLGLLAFSLGNTAQAQDLGSMLGEDEKTGPEYVTATFKDTRLVNFQTVECPGKRTMIFRISHHFGELWGTNAPFGDLFYNFFGFDGGASIRTGFEYSYDSRLAFGVGRTSTDKLFDGFVKYKLLRQTLHSNKVPITVTLLTGTNLTSMRDQEKAINGYEKYAPFSNRMSYTSQIMIASKLSQSLSLQVSPTYLHYNIVDSAKYSNDIYALEFLGRWKFSRSAAITGEYGLRLNKYMGANTMTMFQNSASLGIDIETGGHIFSMFLTNSFGLVDSQFIPYTMGKVEKGNLRFGFNISRVFTL